MMSFLKALFFVILTNVSSSVLNIEELNSIHYSIDIVSNPVLKNQDWSTEIVTVTNKHGQEYVCTLPKVQIPENENKKEEDLLDQLVDISELLKPMEAAPCLIKKKDWWTYEFCYGSVIKQYHLKDNKVVGTILILGKYESEYNWKNNSKSKNKLQKFHTQHYVNGTRCDITGEPRRTEVRFHCEEGVGDYIQQVDEPESCRYVIIIATTRVCHHPYLKPNQNRTPHNINCAPALSHDEFEQYQKIQEVKKAKVERDRLQISDQERASDVDQNQSSDLENSLDGGDADESKWSIRLVTIPISKKGKLTENLLRQGAIDESSTVPDPVDSPLPSEMPESESNVLDDSESFPDAKPYLSETELFEQEFNKVMREFADVKDERTGTETEKEGEEGEEEEMSEKDIKQQYKNFKSRMEKLMEKWMQVQNEDHIAELLEKIKHNLDENVQQLEETASKLNDESLSEYLNDLLKLAEKYKNKLPKVEDLDLENEEKMTDDFNPLPELPSKAEVTVLKALQRKKKLDRLEKFLESELKRTQKENLLTVDDDDDDDEEEEEEEPPLPTHQETDETEDNVLETPREEEIPDSSSFSDLSKSTPSNPSFEDPLDPLDPESDEGETRGTGQDELEEVESVKEGRQVKVLSEKSLDDRKTKLERSIKERLQKSGLDNFGRKIEVKILTPNYFDDDEKDSLSSLSQEETEAFHNMIVNILSASAEELQEREKHKILESNYNFRLEDPEVIIEEGGISSGNVPDFEKIKDDESVTLTELDENNNNDDNNNNNNNLLIDKGDDEDDGNEKIYNDNVDNDNNDNFIGVEHN